MKVKVLMITYNRADYTRLTLETLCKSLPDYASITIWDNSSNAETRAVLKEFEKHPRVERVIYHSTNDRLRGPTNWFWEETKDADFVSKVDDDCLMPPGWCETLVEAHHDIPKAGALGCWRFLDEDFKPELANRKIQSFGKHRLMRNCWVEGSGYLLKREVVNLLGPLRESESFPSYCIRASTHGSINGWYYPFLFQEHMDDPRVPHSGIRTDEDFQRLRPLSAQTFEVQSKEQWIERLKYSAWTLQAISFDPKDHVGWRSTLRRRFNKLFRTKLLPRA
ncbi:MAG: glycosyltransferase family 2 protein [Akkermansiaceae bacterium]|nr:glycosyltransferase family 2 protein [Verrucomicrobiales bacterium]